MTLSHNDLLLINLTKLVSQTDQISLTLETDELQISVSRGNLGLPDKPAPVLTSTDSPPASAPEQVGVPAISEALVEEGQVYIRAPITGTYYSSSEPGAEPFCEVGSEIDKDDTVCILEVMKLFNSVPSGVAGRIARVFKTDGASVEAGEPLFLIETQ